ncbi:MAG TPA: hypothetical protein VMV99_02015, partial [Rhodanobacter sp.]|nr:hypothetical protein [Rhodanobacter sp.]
GQKRTIVMVSMPSEPWSASSVDHLPSHRGSGEKMASAKVSVAHAPRSLSGFGGRGENSAVRGQIFDGSPAHGGSMGQEAAGIWTAQTDSQTDRPKPDRLPDLDAAPHRSGEAGG